MCIDIYIYVYIYIYIYKYIYIYTPQTTSTQVTRGRRAPLHQWHLSGVAGASKHGLGAGEETPDAADPSALQKCRMDAMEGQKS